jgi:toxin ParE1/3/4
MAHRLSTRAQDDLDDIWLYIARESSSLEVANRVIESISNRFLLLSASPYLGRVRREASGQTSRSFPLGEYIITYAIEEDDVLILRVVHGRRDLSNIL